MDTLKVEQALQIVMFILVGAEGFVDGQSPKCGRVLMTCGVEVTGERFRVYGREGIV